MSVYLRCRGGAVPVGMRWIVFTCLLPSIASARPTSCVPEVAQMERASCVATRTSDGDVVGAVEFDEHGRIARDAVYDSDLFSERRTTYTPEGMVSSTEIHDEQGMVSSQSMSYARSCAKRVVAGDADGDGVFELQSVQRWRSGEPVRIVERTTSNGGGRRRVVSTFEHGQMVSQAETVAGQRIRSIATTYREDGSVTRIHSVLRGPSGVLKQVTLWRDARERIHRHEERDGEGRLSTTRHTEYAFDGSSRVERVDEDADGEIDTTVQMQFDALGREVRETTTTGELVSVVDIDWQCSGPLAAGG